MNVPIGACFVALLIVLIPKAPDCAPIYLQIFDPNGNPASLFYDGGSIDVYCFYGDSLTVTDSQLYKPRQIQMKSIRNNAMKTEHRQPIKHTRLNMTYTCHSRFGDNNITIGYILCNPTKMPSIDCAEATKHCQITPSNSPMCTHLHTENCPRKSIGYNLPEYACVGKSKRGQKYCNALSEYNESDINFVAVKAELSYCKANLKFYLTANNSSKKLHLYMNIWMFIDVKYPYYMYVTRGGNLPTKLSFSLNATVNGPITPSISPLPLSTNSDGTNITKLVKDIEQLQKPVHAFVSFYGIDYSERYVIGYSAQLFIFNSSRDWKHQILEGTPHTNGENVEEKLSITVTAVSGLCVCAKEGITKCIPNTTSSNETAHAVITYKRGKREYTASFYIGLFTWSSKKRYALIDSKIVKRSRKASGIGSTTADTVTLGGIGSTTADTVTLGAAPTYSNSPGFIAGMVFVASLIAVLILSLAIIAILGQRRKKKQQMAQVGGNYEKGAGAKKKPKDTLGASRTEWYTLRKSSNYSTRKSGLYSDGYMKPSQREPQRRCSSTPSGPSSTRKFSLYGAGHKKPSQRGPQSRRSSTQSGPSITQ